MTAPILTANYDLGQFYLGGRDYAHVPPTRGVFKGNATEALEVNVQVRAI